MPYLSPGEKIYAKFKPSRLEKGVVKYFLPGALAIIIAFVFLLDVLVIPAFLSDLVKKEMLFLSFLIVALVLFATGEMKRKNYGYYAVTNYRIIFDRGIFREHADSVSYTMLVNVRTTKTFYEKIAGLGTIDITTARGQQEIQMRGVRNPENVESLIYSFVEKTKSNRR